MLQWQAVEWRLALEHLASLCVWSSSPYFLNISEDSHDLSTSDSSYLAADNDAALHLQLETMLFTLSRCMQLDQRHNTRYQTHNYENAAEAAAAADDDDTAAADAAEQC